MCFVSSVLCYTEGNQENIYLYTLDTVMSSYLCIMLDYPRDAVGLLVLCGAFTPRPCHVMSARTQDVPLLCSFLGVAFFV